MGCLFICLGFSSHLRIFHLYWDVTIDEGMQILTWRSRPLSSKGSLVCHTYQYCDMDTSFYMVFPDNSWLSNLLPSIWQWSCHYLVYWLRFMMTKLWSPTWDAKGLPTGSQLSIRGNLSVFHQWKYSACPNEKKVGNYYKNG